MILQRINTRGGGVLLRFPCEEEPVPGQCVVFDGKYFVIADHFNGIGAVFTKPKSAIDLPPGTHVDLKPVGRGFDIDVSSPPVIVTGGTGFAAGLSLVRHLESNNIKYSMIAYMRQPSQLDDVLGLLGISHDGRIKSWNTQLSGRPVTPLDPITDPITVSTPFFFAGPKELQEACRSELDKRGLTDVRIRLNY